jgi:hypothetical protein
MLSAWEGGFICHVRICCASNWLFQGTSQIVLSTFWGLRGSWHELSIRGHFEGWDSSVDYLLEALSSLSCHLEDTSWGDHNWWTAHHAKDYGQEQVACVWVVTGIWSWSNQSQGVNSILAVRWVDVIALIVAEWVGGCIVRIVKDIPGRHMLREEIKRIVLTNSISFHN